MPTKPPLDSVAPGPLSGPPPGQPPVPLTGGMLTRAAAMIKCLGHPLRLRLVEGLEGGEQSVTALQAYTGAPQALVSQQLAALRARGLVDARREGAFVYYRIREPRVHAILRCVRRCDQP